MYEIATGELPFWDVLSWKTAEDLYNLVNSGERPKIPEGRVTAQILNHEFVLGGPTHLHADIFLHVLPRCFLLVGGDILSLRRL